MSRIGKQPVTIPPGVKVSQSKEDGRTVLSIEGPKGKLSFPFRSEVAIAIEPSAVKIQRTGEEAFHRAYHGTARALIANMVRGVTQGFEKRLDIEGVGYNAKMEGPAPSPHGSARGMRLTLQIGFSHPVHFELPAGITIEIPKPTSIVIKGPDRQVVGEFAAQVRRVRPPEPYKGKGIRYSDEKVIRKAGKAFGAAE